MNDTPISAGIKVRLLSGADIKTTDSRSFQWVFYLAASFYFGAILLRAILTYRDSAELPPVLGILLAWLALLVSEPAITRRWSSYFPVYLAIQTILVFILLSTPGYPDFFASLFAIPSMQVMLRLSSRAGAAWLVMWTLGMALILARVYESQTLALVLLYTVGNVFYGAYSRATRRAQEARAHNQALAHELEVSNDKLQTYAMQLEQLAVARERNRLARDLHDSVTQTVFSMTLTTQSAALLLDRDPDRVEAQLDRLSQLAGNALAEMQLLITELRPDEPDRAGLTATVRRYLADRRFLESTAIALEVQGEESLSPSEEQNLFHIIQEALNNIVKHARASKAQVRLHLCAPMWIEIEDWGQGFDLQQAQHNDRVGLVSMRERAVEVGWNLHIRTAPGAGTCIRVEKLPEN